MDISRYPLPWKLYPHVLCLIWQDNASTMYLPCNLHGGALVITSILPPGAGDRELGCIKCFPCSSSSRLSFLLLLFFSFSPSSFHIFFRFFVNFCVLSLFNCKMRSSIAFGANNVALPSTISRKQDHEIAKSHIFLAHVSAPNLTNATCTRGVAPAGFKTSTFLTFSTHVCFSQKTYF